MSNMLDPRIVSSLRRHMARLNHRLDSMADEEERTTLLNDLDNASRLLDRNNAIGATIICNEVEGNILDRVKDRMRAWPTGGAR